MKRVLAFCLALLLPVQAVALSCTPHYIEDAYNEAAASLDTYVVVRGDLRFDPNDLPEVDFAKQDEVPPETRIRARLTGQSLTQRGFLQPFAQDITLTVQCAGPWCAKPKQGAHLAFLRQASEGYELVTHPCGAFAFAKPTPQMLDKVHACFTGAYCRPPRR